MSTQTPRKGGTSKGRPVAKPISWDSPEGIFVGFIALLVLTTAGPMLIPQVREKVSDWAAPVISWVHNARPADIGDIPVQPEGSGRGYSRAAFGKDWGKDAAGCSTRQRIEQRDVADAQLRGDCAVVSGTITDPYDGTTATFTAKGYDVDHVVSLAEAWRSGASSWTADERFTFANDPDVLLLVKAGENRAKSDKDPGEWQPSTDAGRCRYGQLVVQIKYSYHLSMDAREAAAVQRDLAKC